MKNLMLLFLLSPMVASSATVTDIGLLPAPVGYTPSSSLCVDINESGQLACKSIAKGVPYKCGFRLAKTCIKTYESLFRFDAGSVSVVFSGINTNIGSLPWTISGINNHGDLATAATIFISDYGKVVENLTFPGGIPVYNSKVFKLDGSSVPFAGVPATTSYTNTNPTAISNLGEIAGTQWAIAYPTYPHGIYGVGGAGLFVGQSTIDYLVSLGDDPKPKTWAHYAFSTSNSLRSYVFDINDNGTVIVGLNGYSTQPQGTKICLYDLSCVGNTVYNAVNRYIGINNYGDTVGYFYPVAAQLANKPSAWVNGTRVDLNEAVAGSGYTVLSVGDINDSLQIAGTCLKNGVQVGCTINL